MIKLNRNKTTYHKKSFLFQENCKEIIKQLLTNNCPLCVDCFNALSLHSTKLINCRGNQGVVSPVP
jgi:hypothetical protein